jgi:transcriptional regulator GlxA family with amidase domain
MGALPIDRRRVPRDSQVDRAIDAMKADPGRRWTVAALGHIAGLSRAAFARRFTLAVGVPPLRWLAEHRIGLAEKHLVDTDWSLAVIAGEVGYRCEFAFSKAFKRLVGIAPGVFRRRVAGGACSALPPIRAAA